MSATGRGYLVSPQAETDLADIWLHGFQSWSADQADQYYLDLINRFELLAANPSMAPEQRSIAPPVRLFPSGSHLILYRAEADHVLIVRVLHNRSNWRALLEN